jgi:hypothetical protein
VFSIGNQRVGIVTEVPVLDGAGNPVVDEAMAPVDPIEAVVWIDGCEFEVQVLGVNQIEQQDVTTTTNEIAWCHLPVTTKGVDDDGDPVVTDTRAITSAMKLRHANLTYEMRGDAVTEIDIRGRQHHVFALCERQTG